MVTCSDPGDGVEATKDTTDTSFHYQNIVGYMCNDDAAMVTRGTLSLRCEANGQWSHEPPTCRENFTLHFNDS